MSKSVGNVIAPQKVMKTLGADIIRLWVCSADYRGEMSVSDEILNRMSDSYRRIRNTVRFLLANTNGFDPNTDLIPIEDMLALDQWAVDKALIIQDEIKQAYDEYQFHSVYQRLHNFCTTDLGSFYLEIVKDRQYTTQANSHARRSAQSAMYHIAEAMVRWIAPVLSFTAEEIWKHLPGERSETIFTETYYEQLAPLSSSSVYSRDEWDKLIAIRLEVSKVMEPLRTDSLIGSSLDAEVQLFCDDTSKSFLGRIGDELRFILITSGIQVSALADKPDDAIKGELDGAEVWIAASVSPHPKCDRCWHHQSDVGEDQSHPTLCMRCVQNVDGDGEPRDFT